ncbi:MAG: hypothetical protein APR55_05075 [Methanolinea sp. SDB]|nr:MAG: hypothetical protein APR55_05075 [Methanolinea sp. SDB]
MNPDKKRKFSNPLEMRDMENGSCRFHPGKIFSELRFRVASKGVDLFQEKNAISLFDCASGLG